MSDINNADLEEFTHAFLICLLWSTTNEEDGNLDDKHDLADIHTGTMAGLRQQCADFFNANLVDINAVIDGEPGYTFATAGHDLALSRNGHGSGFFDCGVDEPGARLQEAAQNVGAAEAYVGDDGMVYVAGLERFGEPQVRGARP
jgi:hypothetical protein